MKRILFISLISWLFVGFLFASEKSWIKDVVKQKAELRNVLVDAGMPSSSPQIKVGDRAIPFSADITGQHTLVLLTEGGPDGTDWDWGIWADAKLVREDGSFIYLDSLTPVYAKAGEGTYRKNENIWSEPLILNGQKYAHGLFCAANGVMVFDLDEEFVRFESIVGLDKQSKTGCMHFRVANIYPRAEAEQLYLKYPNELGALNAQVDGLENWLIASDASIEKGIVERLAARLDDASYFMSEIAKIDALKDVDEQISSFLNLYEKVSHVVSLKEELGRTNEESLCLAFEDMSKMPGYDKEKYQLVINRIKEIYATGYKGYDTDNASALARAEELISLKRKLLLNNPLLKGDKIIAVRYLLGINAHKAMAPDLGTQANNWSNQESARREGFKADIIELTQIKDMPQTRSVYKPDHSTSIADLKLHWDGTRVMFTQTQPDKRWNIHEVDLDGNNFHPLLTIPEPDMEFYDGTYLPDGRVIAISNIGYNGVPCVNGGAAVGNMVLCDLKDKTYRRLTFDQDANWNPVIMNNGRVMYTRWEYTDLTHYYSRIVMSMNPDGTENKALFGSGSMFPNSTFDVQPLPNHASAFVGIISGHHGIARSGRLIMFDPTKARKGVEGMIQEIPFRNRKIEPIVKDELVNGVWPQFIKPSPLNDKYFLVAAKWNPQSLWGIYLVDAFDNVVCLMEKEGEGFISPILVQKKQIPPTIPDRVNLNDKQATVFIQDLYEGEGLRDVPRGTVKALRIHAYEYAYLDTESDHTAQGIQSGWDIKRLLGTVPIEEDGSAIFKIPANTPISIQPLDENGAAIQWMRSWFTGMPGEVVSCVGCHEDQNQIAIPKRVIASKIHPRELERPEGGVRSFTFDLEVQPILDRACVACHDGDKAFDLRGGQKDKLGFGISYLNLHPYVHRQGPEADMAVLLPYEYHVSTSELIRILKKGHHGVQLTEKEWGKLYNWIDYNAPDKGYFKANKIRGIDQVQRRIELTNKYGNGAGVDWKKEIADYATYLKEQGTIEAVLPNTNQEKINTDEISLQGWPFEAEMIPSMFEKEEETHMEIELSPGVTMKFVRIPAGQFVMGSNKGAADNRPLKKVQIDKEFWMAEVEVTNQQYQVICPEHDSRYVDQLWKDHTRPGYPANLPEQPVIRVSFEEAMNYCKELTKKTGLHFTLPTEEQWEWACRAGSDKDFWFGDLSADFGKQENLADAQLCKMAVYGIDPQPMSKTNFWYQYYNFYPKDESIDDGSIRQVDSYTYQPNPFGLYSMHGNIAEWTRSDYDSTHSSKVVRGGSYIDRAKFATSYYRKAYAPWQRVFNVGFRVIIED